MRIAVVGGGIGGLATAHALVGAGHDAHVLEATERVGGVIGTSVVDGYRREHAASSFLGGPPDGALALCNQLGVAVERASPRAKRALDLHRRQAARVAERADRVRAQRSADVARQARAAPRAVRVEADPAATSRSTRSRRAGSGPKPRARSWRRS